VLIRIVAKRVTFHYHASNLSYDYTQVLIFLKQINYIASCHSLNNKLLIGQLELSFVSMQPHLEPTQTPIHKTDKSVFRKCDSTCM